MNTNNNNDDPRGSNHVLLISSRDSFHNDDCYVDYDDYEDGDMKPGYAIGCIILLAGSIILWTIIISVLRSIF